MYFFFPTLNFVQNYYEIYPFLIEKCETRNSGFEISVDLDFQNYAIIWMVMLPWDAERFAEDLYNRLGIILLQMFVLNIILLIEMF
jgi:hypothetical protein